MMDLIPQLYPLFLKCPVICTDSRKVTPGCLFFGLTGDNVDGSVYGAFAVESGASCAVVRIGACENRPGLFFVRDPLEVLQDLASHHRSHLSIPVIGVTGSNGKTTTKELVSAVLSTLYVVKATRGNLNNHIGVPLTVLSIASTDQLAIVEMGANHPGEIQLLCNIARPTHGVVTNIGKAHLEGFGGLEGVKQAKAELYESLSQSGGVAFVNMNEEFLSELSANVAKRIFYGIDNKAAFTLARYQFEVEPSSVGCTLHFVDANNMEWQLTSTLFGAFNVANIATAVAVGLYFEVPGEQICNAIVGFIPNNNRAQRSDIGSNTFILDAYNANPTSMASAIKSFASIVHPNKLMILGAMMELGEYAVSEHFEIARLASSVPHTATIFVGSLFREPAEKLHQQWYSDVEALTKAITQRLPKDALIFVKGSRALHLESLLAGFH